MTKNIKKGDRVELIDDILEGTVSKVNGDSVLVEFDDGFEQEFLSEELIISKPLNINLDKTLIKESILPIQKKTKPKKELYTPEIDLHIHELIDDASRLSNFDILNIQLSKANGFIDWAIKKRFKKIILIHGVGQGVLKEELKTLLRRYDNLEFYDADYQKYGLGATEVKLY
jgi:preprotein translocase subunit YajC